VKKKMRKRKRIAHELPRRGFGGDRGRGVERSFWWGLVLRRGGAGRHLGQKAKNGQDKPSSEKTRSLARSSTEKGTGKWRQEGKDREEGGGPRNALQTKRSLT